MTRYVVFDLDGTLANNKPRAHWLEGEKKDWKTYNSTMANDTPYDDMFRMWWAMYRAYYSIVICTGREEAYRDVTETWLRNNIPNGCSYPDKIYMRPEKDYRSDAIIKSELLDQMTKELGGNPEFWFDDRNQVVDAIRARGIRVLQVAPGDF